MKYLPLIWSGIRRRPMRAALIFLQVSVAFSLFGVLQGLKTGVDQAIAKVRADLLFVAPAVFGGARLPMSYINRLQSIAGVKTVTFAEGMGGIYQRPNQPVGVLAIPASKVWLSLAPRIFTITPNALEALRTTQNGALVTVGAAKRFGWHIGDQLAIKSGTPQRNGSRTWFFDIVGTVTDREPGEDGLIVANYNYLNEARASDRDTVRNFYVIVSDPKLAAAMSDTIDRMFANSPVGTKTASLRDNAEQAMQSIGNVSFAIRWIVSAVLIAVAFSTSTMLMQSVRERTEELAVLKAVGFGNRTVLFLLISESLAVYLVASLTGLALAWIAFPIAAKYVAGLSMPVSVVALGVLGAIFLALITASVPGYRAARLPVAEALAGR